MNEMFIAYFDFLGFKSFIQNNTSEYQSKIMSSIFFEIEQSLSNGRMVIDKNVGKPDLSEAKINCTNFSDTIIFWTRKIDVNNLKNILKVSHRFNAYCNIFTFPVRGTIIKGEVNYSQFNSAKRSVYSVNTLFGKGIIDAYLKTEEQEWAGTVIDDSVIKFLVEKNIPLTKFLNPFAKEYNVPYKKAPSKKVWALKLTESKLEDESFDNIKKKVINNFSKHNKDATSNLVKKKIKNTIDFLSIHKNLK